VAHKNTKPISWHREGDCMICTSHALNSSGYPSIQRGGGSRIKIARQILFRRHGRLPSLIVSRHTCDRRDCINPNHILSGSVKENNNDCLVRGRVARGEKHGTSKLNENNIQEIRLLKGKLTQLQIARRFGVSGGLISKIHRRILWSHIT